MTETRGRLHEISFPSLATCTIPSGQKALRSEFWKNSVSRHLTCALWHHMASTWLQLVLPWLQFYTTEQLKNKSHVSVSGCEAAPQGRRQCLKHDCTCNKTSCATLAPEQKWRPKRSSPFRSNLCTDWMNIQTKQKPSRFWLCNPCFSSLVILLSSHSSYFSLS